MLRIEHLAFSFGPHKVLDDISLHCDGAEIVGVVGRSGVGKSTLLNIAAGILPYRSGRVLLGDNEPKEATKRQKIGYLFQTPSLLPWLTAEENVALPLSLRNGNNPSKSRQAAQAALHRAHIADAAEKYPHEMSGGMQTRAAMARALVYQPAMFLMDEPFNALDDLVKESLYQEFQDVIVNSQTASVLVTHNLSEAVFLCDRVYVLRADAPTEPSRIVHCETIPFGRPRPTTLLNDPIFTTVRARVRGAMA